MIFHPDYPLIASAFAQIGNGIKIRLSTSEPKSRSLIYHFTVNYLVEKPMHYEIIFQKSKIDPFRNLLVTVKSNGKIETSELTTEIWYNRLRDNKHFDHAILYQYQLLETCDVFSLM